MFCCDAVLQQWRLVSPERVADEFIEDLKEKSKNENNKISTERWKNVFVKGANERKKETKSRRVRNDC